jgi:hypothetical protein
MALAAHEFFFFVIAAQAGIHGGSLNTAFGASAVGFPPARQ